MRSASSSAPLGAGGEWVSGWIRRLPHHKSIEGSVFADKAGTLHIEESQDGVNADVNSEYPVAAADGVGISEDLSCRFWRLRYVNGGTQQGAFRISARATPTSPAVG